MILDLIILGLIILAAFNGYKKGLVTVLVGFIGIILSIVFAFLLQSPVSDFISNQTTIDTSIENSVKTGIEKSIESGKTQENTVYSTIMDIAIGKDDPSRGYTIDQEAKVVTDFIIKGISFIVIFIVVFIICYILQMMLNLVFDLPILDSVNKFGGLTIEIIKMLIKITILFAIVVFVSGIPLFSGIVDIIKTSTIGNYFYSNNIIVDIVKSTLKI